MSAMNEWTVHVALKPVAKGNCHEVVYARKRGRLGNASHPSSGTWECRRVPQIVNSAEANGFIAHLTALLRLGEQPVPPIGANEKLALTVAITFPDYRQDGDLELIADCLQKAGIVPNDRQFRDKRVVVADEKGSPNMRITVARLGPLPWKSRTGKRSN